MSIKEYKFNLETPYSIYRDKSFCEPICLNLIKLIFSEGVSKINQIISTIFNAKAYTFLRENKSENFICIVFTKESIYYSIFLYNKRINKIYRVSDEAYKIIKNKYNEKIL